MLSEAEIYEVLSECYDPEIPVNIVELGLVYGVDIKDSTVNVTMTLTTQGCSLGDVIRNEIEEKLLGIPDCNRANVDIVFDPPWNPHMMSDEARRKLGLED